MPSGSSTITNRENADEQPVVREMSAYLAFYGVFVSAVQLLEAVHRFKQLHKTLSGIDWLINLQQSSELRLKKYRTALTRFPLEVMLFIRSFVKQKYLAQDFEWMDNGDLRNSVMCRDCKDAYGDWRWPHWIEDFLRVDNKGNCEVTWGRGYLLPSDDEADQVNPYVEYTEPDEKEYIFQDMAEATYPDYCIETQANWDAMCEVAYAKKVVVALLKEYNLESSVRGYRPIFLDNESRICKDSKQVIALTSRSQAQSVYLEIWERTEGAEDTRGPGRTVALVDTDADATELFKTAPQFVDRDLLQLLEDWELAPVSERQAMKVAARTWKRFQAEVELKPEDKLERLKKSSARPDWWIWDLGRGATNEDVELEIKSCSSTSSGFHVY